MENIIPDILWNKIKDLLPKKKSKIGRPQSDPKLILSGIFYIMTTGIQWRYLPHQYGPVTTVHGRFIIWSKTGVFHSIFNASIDLAIQSLGTPKSFLIDTSSAKAPFANFSGKNPTDRAKHGIKKSIVADWNGIILSIIIDAANKHDSKLVEPHISDIRKFLNLPKVIIADAAYDDKKLRKKLAESNLALHAATNPRRNKLKEKVTPKGRWKIEQIFGIQQWYRGIKFCWTKTKGAFFALLQLASSVHNFKRAGIFG